ncbi:MAG: 23S rRNA (uracil(1939)-C(5))-methyltransferase RlmD [Candidatus Acidiferrales bacterium]
MMKPRTRHESHRATPKLASFDVRLEKLVYGGEALAHHNGATVFVPLGLAGELVQVEPTEQKKKFIRGRVAMVLKPSAERIQPRCPHFGTCGGCHYQNLAYPAQVRAKTEILRETLGRIGRVRWDGPIATHSFAEFGYRNRAQWRIRRAGGALGIGYFQGRSQELCPVQECPILSPRLEATLRTLAGLLADGRLPAGTDEIEAFADAEDSRLLLSISVARLEDATELPETLRNALPEMESLLLLQESSGRMELHGPGYLHYRVGKHNYRVGHLSFFQVNRFALETIVTSVMGERRGKLALDLFAGVGLFTVPLAQRFERVVAVESSPAAMRDLEFNLQESGGTSAAARESTTELFLPKWHDRPDFVVLDPPRAGVDEAALRRLIKLAPPEISYLSCDPATLARDLAVLTGTEAAPGAYRIGDLQLFDIFPQTFHMEALVRLERRT